jgi:hypothetical protein
VDDNQYSDAAYETAHRDRLRSLTRHLAIVGGFFLFYFAGFVSAALLIPKGQ